MFTVFEAIVRRTTGQDEIPAVDSVLVSNTIVAGAPITRSDGVEAPVQQHGLSPYQQPGETSSSSPTASGVMASSGIDSEAQVTYNTWNKLCVVSFVLTQP